MEHRTSFQALCWYVYINNKVTYALCFMSIYFIFSENRDQLTFSLINKTKICDKSGSIFHHIWFMWGNTNRLSSKDTCNGKVRNVCCVEWPPWCPIISYNILLTFKNLFKWITFETIWKGVQTEIRCTLTSTSWQWDSNHGNVRTLAA